MSSKQLDFRGVLNQAFYSFMDGITRLTSQQNTASDIIDELRRAINNGNVLQTKTIAQYLIQSSSEDLRDYMEVPDLLSELSAFLPRLDQYLEKDTIPGEELQSFSELCLRAARIFKQAAYYGIAFNFYELNYGISSWIGLASYEAATNLLNLASKEDKLQYHTAIWHFAAAQVLESLRKQDDWMKAIDAVELAFTVEIDNAFLKISTRQSLTDALKQTSGTPLQVLLTFALLFFSLDKNDPGREQLIKIILGETGSVKEEPPVGRKEDFLAFRELMAMIKVQNSIDDERIAQQFPDGAASLTLHDLTLNHRNLTSAIPLMSSLIIDPDRTNRFMLDLVHEITHAYSMIGSIGYHRIALRVALHICEMILIVQHDGVLSPEDKQFKPLEAIAKDGLSVKVAEIQLSISYRSSILESLWTPWLEGIAQYVEMLADPRKDPLEILPVYEAIRSLIEIDVKKKDSESPEEYIMRYTEELSRKFEDFCSNAVQQLSEERHIAHIEPSSVSYPKETRNVYLLGYLLVRSVVSCWETTIGYRLEPVIISKLLLYLTRHSTQDAIPDLTLALEEVADKSREQFKQWLIIIAGLPKADLEHFLESVEKDQKSFSYLWKDGRPVRMPDSSEGLEASERLLQKLTDNVSDLIKGKGFGQACYSFSGDQSFEQIVDEAFAPYISDQLNSYAIFMSLLPVGKDYSRILFSEYQDRVALCPRTYIGYTHTVADDRNSYPRYSVFIFNLKDKEERERLRILCGEHQTARLLATRIIDLQGHTFNPLKAANSSFVCFFMKEGWQRITASFLGGKELNEEHKPFTDTLRDRIYAPGFFANEIGTLSSAQFLLKRFTEVSGTSDIQEYINAFDEVLFAEKVAIDSSCQAFATNEAVLKEALSTLDNRNTRIAFATYFYNTGFMGLSPKMPYGLLADLTLNTQTFSGIKPFNI